jgi:tetratricopeptide (TPR) repeat protein
MRQILMLVSQLAGLYAASGQIEEALARAKQATELCPSHAKGLLNLGRELIRAGENVAAIQWLAQAIQLQPDHFEAYHQLGSMMPPYRHHKEERAIPI